MIEGAGEARVGPGLVDVAGDQARNLVEFGEANNFDSLWVGDHIAFPVPITDSLSQLACAAAYAETLTLGTCVFLLPLRHPTPVAKQVATIDTLADGI